MIGEAPSPNEIALAQAAVELLPRAANVVALLPSGPAERLEEIVARAVHLGASDIHCDPAPGELSVSFRVDGMLVTQSPVAGVAATELIAQLKRGSGIDAALIGVPQEGRMTVAVDERRVELRVVTLPLLGGEGVRLRILDSLTVVRNLRALGMRERERDRFATACGRASGAVLVSGPTGAGKSATLYSALGQLADARRSVLTIEDPIEAQIPGIQQMQVSPAIGMSFATGLRALLHADPDVVMVGEIRDADTAQLSVQTALAGQLLLAAIHTRDAASALTRLVEMGNEPFMVAASVSAVVGQRLVRTLCPHCKRAATLSSVTREEHGLLGGELYEPVGCVRCGETGFDGRIGIFEVLPVTERIRGLILDRRDADAIRTAAVRAGMRTMRDDGIDKVRQGLTSLAEVGRVTAPH